MQDNQKKESRKDTAMLVLDGVLAVTWLIRIVLETINRMYVDSPLWFWIDVAFTLFWVGIFAYGLGKRHASKEK